jgi:hypothetical protein
MTHLLLTPSNALCSEGVPPPEVYLPGDEGAPPPEVYLPGDEGAPPPEVYLPGDEGAIDSGAGT